MTDFATALARLWPNGDEKITGLRAGIVENAGDVFAKYGINTPLVLAHFMAQVSHECGAGHDVVENLNYTPQRLIEVWPRHFNSGNAAIYAHNPDKLGNFIYNPPQHNDLGNRAGTDDGYRYRGRGGAQTTGRSAYDHLEKETGLPLLDDPDLVNDPSHFLECAAADFIACGCLPFACEDNVVSVTKKLNGGTVGLAERKQWLSRWKALNVSVPIAVKPLPSPDKPVPPAIPPSVSRPEPGSIGEFIARLISAFLSIFKRK